MKERNMWVTNDAEMLKKLRKIDRAYKAERVRAAGITSLQERMRILHEARLTQRDAYNALSEGK